MSSFGMAALRGVFTGVIGESSSMEEKTRKLNWSNWSYWNCSLQVVTYDLQENWNSNYWETYQDEWRRVEDPENWFTHSAPLAGKCVNKDEFVWLHAFKLKDWEFQIESFEPCGDPLNALKRCSAGSSSPSCIWSVPERQSSALSSKGQEMIWKSNQQTCSFPIGANRPI